MMQKNQIKIRELYKNNLAYLCIASLKCCSCCHGQVYKVKYQQDNGTHQSKPLGVSMVRARDLESKTGSPIKPDFSFFTLHLTSNINILCTSISYAHIGIVSFLNLSSIGTNTGVHRYMHVHLM